MKRELAQVITRKVAPTASRVVRVQVTGATCAACGRDLRLGDRALIQRGRLVHPPGVPCVPAWERS